MHRYLHEFHRRLALLLALPLMLVVISGLLIASRHLGDLQVPMSWMFRKPPQRLPMSVYLPLPDGSAWIGTPQGLKHLGTDRLQNESAFDGLEITALASLPDHPYPVVATRTALWSRTTEGPWEMRLRGRVRQLSLNGQGELLVIIGGEGPISESHALHSADGHSWFADPAAQRAARSLPALNDPTVRLSQFATELHSGTFLLGRGTGELIWTLTLGGALLLLTLSGFWIAWIHRRGDMNQGSDL